VRSSPQIFGPDQFISIVISSFYRPFYLKRCLESIHKHADMPFEIIVHDDGSGQAERDQIYRDLSPLISTLILNLGGNMGLNVSANRAVGS
jgi:glycosyltransferase involved in cell wall biosynthesis